VRYLVALFAALLAFAAPAAQAGTITGTVTNAAGDPAGSVSVEALHSPDANVTLAVQTAANGTYSLSNLPAGPYWVRFGRGHATLATEHYDNAVARTGAQLVNVPASGTIAGIDATLSAYPKVSGTVTGPSGPLTGVRVTVESNTSQHTATTGTDGSYSITVRDPDAAQRSYKIHFQAPTGTQFVDEWHSNKLLQAQGNQISLALGSTTTIDAQLALGGNIAGRVTDPDGVAFDVSSIHVRGVGNNYVREIVAAADGTWSTPGIPAGNYTVVFDVFQRTPLNSMTLYYDDKPDEDSADLVEVRSGQITPGIDAEIPRRGGIQGKVTGEGGGPWQSVPVEVYKPDGTLVAETLTLAGGTYEFRSLLPGSYRVHFAPELRAGARWYDAKPTLESSDPVTVNAGAYTTGIDAQLTGGAIAGTVKRSNGAPSGFGDVDVYDEHGAHVAHAWLLDNGTYRIAGLLPGRYRVHFDVGGTEPEFHHNKATLAAADPVTVNHSEVTVNAVLDEGVVFEGTVRLDNGQLANGAFVQAIETSGLPTGSGSTTGPDGRYRISGLLPGTYKLRFGGGNGLTEYHHDKRSLAAADTLTASDGEHFTINAELTRYGIVQGVVRAAETGNAISGAKVYLIGEDGYRAGPFRSDWHGYRSKALRPGRYKVFFGSPYTSRASEYYQDAPTLSAATWVTVTGGATVNVSAGLALKP
jgi:hypothetical protein